MLVKSLRCLEGKLVGVLGKEGSIEGEGRGRGRLFRCEAKERLSFNLRDISGV